MSLPGTVDQQRGCSLDSPIMSGWDGVPLPPYFAELTDAPVILDNDVNVIALAERRGERQAFDDLLVIKASTGLGAGIIAGRFAAARCGAGGGGVRSQQDTSRRRRAVPMRRHRLPGGDRGRLGAGAGAAGRRAAPSATCATSWSWPTAVTPKRVG